MDFCKSTFYIGPANAPGTSHLPQCIPKRPRNAQRRPREQAGRPRRRAERPKDAQRAGRTAPRAPSRSGRAAHGASKSTKCFLKAFYFLRIRICVLIYMGNVPGGLSRTLWSALAPRSDPEALGARPGPCPRLRARARARPRGSGLALGPAGRSRGSLGGAGEWFLVFG